MCVLNIIIVKQLSFWENNEYRFFKGNIEPFYSSNKIYVARSLQIILLTKSESRIKLKACCARTRVRAHSDTGYLLFLYVANGFRNAKSSWKLQGIHTSVCAEYTRKKRFEWPFVSFCLLSFMRARENGIGRTRICDRRWEPRRGLVQSKIEMWIRTWECHYCKMCF